MNEIKVRVRLDGEKWWVWVNESRFMGFKSEGDAVGVCRRLADIIVELKPSCKVTYSPMQPKAQPLQTPADKSSLQEYLADNRKKAGA